MEWKDSVHCTVCSEVFSDPALGTEIIDEGHQLYIEIHPKLQPILWLYRTGGGEGAAYGGYIREGIDSSTQLITTCLHMLLKAN